MNTILKTLAIAVLVIGVGIGVGLLVTGGRRIEFNPPAPSASSTGTIATTAVVPRAVPAIPGTSPQPVVLPKVDPTTAAPPAGTNVLTDWEDRLDKILGAETEEKQKVREMAALFPKLPEDGQTEVAQHLANLTSDEDYALFTQITTNATLPEGVLDIALSDVLNRPNALKLPVLLEVARMPDHPKAEEAKDLLELFLEEDHGTDWATWQTKMDEWLKANPD